MLHLQKYINKPQSACWQLLKFNFFYLKCCFQPLWNQVSWDKTINALHSVSQWRPSFVLCTSAAHLITIMNKVTTFVSICHAIKILFYFLFHHLWFVVLYFNDTGTKTIFFKLFLNVRFWLFVFIILISVLIKIIVIIFVILEAY